MADHYFRCHRDYERAQQELAIARPNLPNSVSFFSLAGYIERRRGQWPEAERDFASAVTIDPRNPNAVNLLVDTYVLQRRFPEGKRAYDRAIAAGMQQPIAYIRRAAMDFGDTGESTTLRAALDKWPEVDVGGGETAWRIMLAMIDRNFDAAHRVLAQSPRADFQEVDFSFYFPRAWYEAIIARARGDQAKAVSAFADARAVFESRLQLKPEDPRTLAVLAQVDAGLGRKELAIREAKHAVELMPISRDAYDAPLVQQGLAQVYVWTGEKEQALQLLEQLVSIPSYLSYGYLRFDPQWEPLHGDARFEKIVASIAPNQLKNSASGSIGSMCAQKILKAARMGTARMTPAIPHIHPQNTSDKAHDGIERERPAHHPRRDEISFQRGQNQISRGKNQRVSQAVETEDSAKCHANDSGERTEIRNKIQDRDHRAPHDWIAQTEKSDSCADGDAETDVDDCDREQIARNVRCDVVRDRNRAFFVGESGQ